MDLATEDPTIEITVDLEKQEVRGDGFAYHFEIDAFARDMLLNGLDEITLVERHAPDISTFESQRPAWLPTAG
jgi:3-isopropylmalate/(R)-2-methylmalate dehydratase small subunit